MSWERVTEEYVSFLFYPPFELLSNILYRAERSSSQRRLQHVEKFANSVEERKIHMNWTSQTHVSNICFLIIILFFLVKIKIKKV